MTPQRAVMPFPDETCISAMQSVSMCQTLNITDVEGFENTYRIMTRANTCF